VSTEAISRTERLIVGRLVKTFFAGHVKGRAWPIPEYLPHERLRFEGNTGARLAGIWFPAEKPRGAVVLVHPHRRYGKHWFVKSGWVDFLRSAGFDTLTFDLAGYGESRGPATYYHEDVLAAVEVARRWSGGLPVHVVGVSIGAFAAANAAPRLERVEGLVLESPFPSFNEWYGGGRHRRLMEVFDRTFPKSSRAIQADFNIAGAAARRVLVAIAEQDEITSPALSEAVALAAPASRTEVVRVPGARHLEPFERSAAYRAAVLRALGVEPAEHKLRAVGASDALNEGGGDRDAATMPGRFGDRAPLQMR